MAPSLCWTSALVGCLLLASLCEIDAVRQNNALIKQSGHVPHHHHSGGGHARSARTTFEGDVLPGREDAEGLESSNAARVPEESAQQESGQRGFFLTDFLGSLFFRSTSEGTAVTAQAQTNCHLLGEENCNKPTTRLDTAIDFLSATFSRKPSSVGQGILPADESEKPAEIDPVGNRKGEHSDAGKKILPAHEGTKPAELDPAKDKPEGSKRASWTSIVKAFASAKTPGHAGADISTTSSLGRSSTDGTKILPADEGKGNHPADVSLGRPSIDGKTILPADEGKGDHPPAEEMTSEDVGLSEAYAETRARMLISAGSPSTSTVAQDFLAAHNAARSQVGVPPMEWNKTLAVFAQQWANYDKANSSCAMNHRPTSGPYRRIYGENIAWNGGFKSSASQITGLWVAESVNYNYTANTCAAGKVCGHYTAVVWKTSTQVGCAVVACPDPIYRMTQFWVCNYWPNGNIIGQRPY